MEQEIWKNIEGFSGYQISNLGNVKSLKFNKRIFLKKIKGVNGYYVVNLYKNKIRKKLYIHRLVAKAFIPNSENKPEVNHIDGSKSNNQVTNLEWITHKQNIQHGWQTGLCDSKKVPIYSSKLDIQFESTVEAANYVKTHYFENAKLINLQIYISLLLNNKITKSKFDFGWQYV